MSQVLDDLVNLLTLEPIEENLFRGSSQDLGFRQLFGGQVLGQSLSAMSQTVEDARHVQSMHGYFLRPGDASLPVVYQVDRVRDGGSFETRMGGVACWNALMDENAYLVQKWNEFVAA